jgi:hypothetical protein
MKYSPGNTEANWFTRRRAFSRSPTASTQTGLPPRSSIKMSKLGELIAFLLSRAVMFGTKHSVCRLCNSTRLRELAQLRGPVDGSNGTSFVPDRRWQERDFSNVRFRLQYKVYGSGLDFWQYRYRPLRGVFKVGGMKKWAPGKILNLRESNRTSILKPCGQRGVPQESFQELCQSSRQLPQL